MITAVISMDLSWIKREKPLYKRCSISLKGFSNLKKSLKQFYENFLDQQEMSIDIYQTIVLIILLFFCSIIYSIDDQ